MIQTVLLCPRLQLRYMRQLAVELAGVFGIGRCHNLCIARATYVLCEEAA